MRAWVVDTQGPVDGHPPVLVDLPDPEPGPGEVLVAVDACGVCRTDLHIVEGDLPLRRRPVVPGHEVVGRVVDRGPGAERFALGDRVGVAWLRRTCGTCRFCRSARENLCLEPRFTGWDDHGGYAELTVVDERYAYRLPEVFDDEHAAPLLCAGIIGYRALRQCDLPPCGRLGIWGFGASAHLALQVAVHEGAEVHVVTRSEHNRQLALELGAASATGPADGPPVPVEAGIVFAPSGAVVPAAMAALDRGATLAVAGIHLSDIERLRYADHLFYERRLRSVTANTRDDGHDFLELAAMYHLGTVTVPYPFTEADRALADLAHGRLRGAAVIRLR